MGNARALCVGINRFESLPETSWLYGCVNDAEDMASVLRGRWALADDEVMVLRDSQATKAHIMELLSDMVDRAVGGDIERMVFSFSSHGTQVPDRNDEESDLADEALAAYDLREAGDEWDRATMIVDDELHELFGRVPREVLVEVFLDTCHSGTGLRAIDLLPGRRPKFLTPPTPLGLTHLEDRGVLGLLDRGRSIDATSNRPVLFAACTAQQTASDANFRGRYNGAFTYHLLKALGETADPVRRDVLMRLRTGLKDDHFRQSPQLEATAAAKRAVMGALE